MSLPESDLTYLREREIQHELIVESNMTCIVIPGLTLPPGFNVPVADLLLRLAAGYPDVPPDCWWFDPAVTLASGISLPATGVFEQLLGRRWQRWSRHFNGGQWQSGIDGLESFLALIRAELNRCVPEIVR